MKFERLLELIGDEPVFETTLLFAGKVNPALFVCSSPVGQKAGVFTSCAGVFVRSPRRTKK